MYWYSLSLCRCQHQPEDVLNFLMLELHTRFVLKICHLNVDGPFLHDNNVKILFVMHCTPAVDVWIAITS